MTTPAPTAGRGTAAHTTGPRGSDASGGPGGSRASGDSGGPALDDRLDAAVHAVEAPHVVFAASVGGRRAIRSGGTAPPPAVERARLRYEAGSASKPYTGLLLAALTLDGTVGRDTPALACLAPGAAVPDDPVTLLHLVTHTSRLPALPRDFYRQALPRWSTNPFAGYPAAHVVDAFVRRETARTGPRVRRRPGTRWHYSNFGVSVLGHALAAATRTPWETLLHERVLAPLALSGTALTPAPPPDFSDVGPARAGDAADAVGHRADGVTPVPPLRIGGFAPAGGVRTTPADALTFLEAHLHPERTPLAEALHAVRAPLLRRGLGHRHTHTLTWFQHPTEHGPAYFHCGATSGQQTFLGFCPGADVAVAAHTTRRYHRTDPFLPTAYTLLLGPDPLS
ncbi:serine hydrolase domain-containing protein [Streptomyces sp. NRRL F-5053]|uniref:serine hydrolase domain-containing protein n=1 Tax=Streptomyces sp. NRRL F-5053 TaxID=1463854 RepID=UPI00099DAC79|nr:serine hydrolase domain-containing protein [Streptomyces sp. NRRL F-5053]